MWIRLPQALVVLWACLVSLVPGCSSQDSVEDLQAMYFDSLSLEDAGAKLVDLELRMDRAVAALVSEGDPADRDRARKALFYAGFLPHVALHGVEDGYLPDGPTNVSTQLDAMRRSKRHLTLADTITPKDPRVTTVLRSVRFNEEMLRQNRPEPGTLILLTDAVAVDLFSTFAGLILLRDPERFPMKTAQMEKFFAAVCAPTRFDCDRMGPPPMMMTGMPTLTTKVAGPVILADLLMRRGEMLINRADELMDKRAESLMEAQGRLTAARGILTFAEINLVQLDHYPAKDGLEPRKARLMALLQATQNRLQEPPMATPLPETSFYDGKAYRSAYQCVSCHTRAKGSTEAVPQ